MVILIIITTVFIIIYKRKKPGNCRQLIECLDPLRLIGVLMALLSDVESRAKEIDAPDVLYDAYFS